MKTIPPLSLILFIYFIQCCPVDKTTFGCTFYVKSTDQTCTSFALQQCEWTQCDYYFKDKNNNSKCGHSSTISSKSWGKCMSQCCYGMDAPQTYDSLNQCIQRNIQIALIVGLLVAGIVIIIIICLCFHCRQKIRNKYGNICACCKCCTWFKKSDINNTYKDSPQISATQQIAAKLQWIQCQTKFINKEFNCAICLDNDCNSSLNCNHNFHRKCILHWIKVRGRKQCPFCNTQIQMVTLYCISCLKRKKELTRQMCKIQYDNLNRTCESCSFE